jgi:hypothetical protein
MPPFAASSMNLRSFAASAFDDASIGFGLSGGDMPGALTGPLAPALVPDRVVPVPPAGLPAPVEPAGALAEDPVEPVAVLVPCPRAVVVAMPSESNATESAVLHSGECDILTSPSIRTRVAPLGR